MSKKAKKYGGLYYEYTPSLTRVIKDYIADKNSPPSGEHGIPMVAVAIPPEKLELFHFALVVDGEVKEVIRVNRIIANYFNQDFKLIEFHPDAIPVMPGDTYSDDTFTKHAS